MRRRTTRSMARPSTVLPIGARRGRAPRSSGCPKTPVSSWRRPGTSSLAARARRAGSGSALRPGVLFRTDDGGETWQPVDGIVRHETRDRWNPGAGGMCCHSIALDPDEPERMYVGISAAGVFRSEDARRELDAGEPGHRCRLHAGSLPGAGAVRAQAAPPPESAGSPVAAEPLRRLPLGRPRRELGAPRGKRPPERLRLPAGARPPRSRRSLRRSRGEPGEPRHAQRAARRLPDKGRRLVVGAPDERAAAARLGVGDARGLRAPTGSTRPASTSARRVDRSSSPRTPATRGSKPLRSSRRSSRWKLPSS